jgi:hypothetical protein
LTPGNQPWTTVFPHFQFSSFEDIQRRREGDREHIAQFTNQIADAQSELEMLRARWKQLTDEEKRLIGDNARLWDDLTKARNVSLTNWVNW